MCGVVAESKSPLLKKGTRVMSIFNQTHLKGQINEDDLASVLGFPLPGVLAQYRCFVAESLVVVPDYLTDEVASCLPIAGVTAWMSINGMRPLGKPADYSDSDKTSKREVVLLQGTGGVSMAGLRHEGHRDILVRRQAAARAGGPRRGPHHQLPHALEPTARTQFH